jgi:hypothetical protein
VIGTGDQQRLQLRRGHGDRPARGGRPSTAKGRVYNIAGGRPVSIRALVDLIIADRDPPSRHPLHHGELAGDVVRMVADTTRITGTGSTSPGSLERASGTIDWHR